MKILLTNRTAKQVSLDLFISKESPIIRGIIPVGGNLDIGDRISLEELAMSQVLQELIINSVVGLSVESETTDIDQLLSTLSMTAQQVIAASATLGMGVMGKTGTIKSAQAGSVVIAAAGESLEVDILKNGTTILDSAIVLDDSVTVRIPVEGVLDSTTLQVEDDDFFEAVLTYVAGGGPTPISSTLVQVEIIPA